MMYTKIFDPVSSYKIEVKSQERSLFRKKDTFKEYSPIRRLSDENVSWLANEWIKENGHDLPTRRQILDGIIDEDRKEILRLYPRFSETHAAVEEVLKKRALAWKTLCTVSGFSIKNMDAPIKKETLQDQPFHPLSATIMQIMILDSTIRNAISRASYEKKQDSVKSLGPICVMLQFLISVSKAKRMNDEIEGCHFWVGAQLSE